MIYLPFVAILLIYLVVAMLKPRLQTKLPFNLCAICVAVSFTWAGLLLWPGDWPEKTLTLAILMGMSISGIMYKAEAIYKKHKVQNFWLVRLLIIIGGFYAVYNLLLGQWASVLVILIALLFTIIIASLLFQGVTHADALKEVKKKSIVKKLEDCC